MPSKSLSYTEKEQEAQGTIDVNLKDWVSCSEQTPFTKALPVSLAAAIQKELISEKCCQALENVKQHLSHVPASPRPTAADPSPKLDRRPPTVAQNGVWVQRKSVTTNQSTLGPRLVMIL